MQGTVAHQSDHLQLGCAVLSLPLRTHLHVRMLLRAFSYALAARAATVAGKHLRSLLTNSLHKVAYMPTQGANTHACTWRWKCPCTHQQKYDACLKQQRCCQCDDVQTGHMLLLGGGPCQTNASSRKVRPAVHTAPLFQCLLLCANATAPIGSVLTWKSCCAGPHATPCSVISAMRPLHVSAARPACSAALGADRTVRRVVQLI